MQNSQLKPITNTLKFIVFITLFFTLSGLIFKLMLWPGANVFFALGTFSFALLYLPVITFHIYTSQTEFRQRLNTVFIFLCILIVSIGTTFAFLNYPGAKALLQINKVIILGCILPYAIYHLFKSYKQPAFKTHALVLGVYFSAIFLSLIFIIGKGKINIRPILQHTEKIELQVRDYKSRNLQLRQYLMPLEFNNKQRFIALCKISDGLWNTTQHFKNSFVNTIDNQTLSDTAWFSGLDIKNKLEIYNQSKPNSILTLKQAIKQFNDSSALIYQTIKKEVAAQSVQINISDLKNEDGSIESWEQYYIFENYALIVFNTITGLQQELINAENLILLEFVNQVTAEQVHSQKQFKMLLQHNLDQVINEHKQKLEALHSAHEQRQKSLNQKNIELQSIKDQNTLMVLSIFIFLGLIAYVIFSNVQRKRLITTLHVQNQKIELQKTELIEKQHEILDSITYARRLQEAILPNKQVLSMHFKQCYIYYKPKAIVAGDFYWFEQKNDWIYVAVADCTGHGVPGAMVSMVGYNALQRALFEFNCIEPGALLDKARDLITDAFSNQKLETVKDGMDISLVAINKTQNTILWAGAHNPLWTLDVQGLHEIKATKQSVGFAFDPKPFSTHSIPYQENLYLFLFTDGMPDQFGGPNGKKMKYKLFSEHLIQMAQAESKNAVDILDQKFVDWMEHHEQIDDVCIIALQLK